MYYDFSLSFRDVLAAVLGQLDAMSGAALCIVFGFGLLPAAFGFLIGVIGHGSLGIVAPISFQQETIVLAGRSGRNIQERLNIVMIAGLGALGLGLLGALEFTIDFMGDAVFFGLIAGVGIYLARAGLDLARENLPIGIGTILAALLILFVTDDLLYAIAASLLTGIIMGRFIEYKSPIDQAVKEGTDMSWFQKLHFAPPRWSIIKRPNVIRGILAAMTLQIGGNIAYGNATAELGDPPKPINVDHLTIVSGTADFTSAIFGGAPVETILSPTGAAPNPYMAGLIFMAIAAVLIYTRVFFRIARYLPLAALAGFLFVLGTFGAFLPNVAAALEQDPEAGAAAMVVTGLVDPFTGAVVGVMVRYLLVFFGGS